MVYAHVTVEPDVGRSCMCDSGQWRLCTSTQSPVASHSHHCTSDVHRLCQHVQREKLHEIGSYLSLIYLLHYVVLKMIYTVSGGTLSLTYSLTPYCTRTLNVEGIQFVHIWFCTCICSGRHGIMPLSP